MTTRQIDPVNPGTPGYEDFIDFLDKFTYRHGMSATEKYLCFFLLTAAQLRGSSQSHYNLDGVGSVEVTPKNLNEPEKKILDYMNSLVAADEPAIRALMTLFRCRCNSTLANHPTCQVATLGAAADGVTTEGTFDVGPLGVMCGLVEELVGKRLAAVFENGVLKRFKLLPPSEFSG